MIVYGPAVSITRRPAGPPPRLFVCRRGPFLTLSKSRAKPVPAGPPLPSRPVGVRERILKRPAIPYTGGPDPGSERPRVPRRGSAARLPNPNTAPQDDSP